MTADNCFSGCRIRRGVNETNRCCREVMDFASALPVLFAPDGQISSIVASSLIPFVQPLREKYCCFEFSEFVLSHPRSVPARGAYASSRNAERNAVDAKALTDERRLLRTVKSCGPGAPRSGAKLAKMPRASRRRRWQTEWFTEESAYKP